MKLSYITALMLTATIFFGCGRSMDEPEENAEKTEAAENKPEEKNTVVYTDSTERKAIEEYVKSHKLKGEFTKSGMFVVIENQGTGAFPTEKSMAKADYSGYFMDGKPFDASKPGNPLEFSLSGGVIQGWLEGFKHFKKGGSGKLIIPSSLAYGPEGQGPIPPHTPLIFDVKLVDFK